MGSPASPASVNIRLFAGMLRTYLGATLLVFCVSFFVVGGGMGDKLFPSGDIKDDIELV